MTTFTWKVANLERNLADGRVGTVHYTVNALSDQVDPNSESGGFWAYMDTKSAVLNLIQILDDYIN